MKKCPYCGEEYPDDATVCAIDTNELVDHPPKPKPVEEIVIDRHTESERLKEKAAESTRIWPDYQWRAKDAWKCIGMIILLTELVLPAGYYTLDSYFPIFDHALFFRICRRLLLFSIWTVTACYFARTETLAAVKKAFGLDHKPTNLIWFGLAMTLAIRFATHFMFVLHWGRGAYNDDLYAIRNTTGFQKIFFQLSPLVLAPIFEEIVDRGFLYKAFRASFSVAVSVLIMIGWTLWTHYPYWRESWIAALYYSAWTVLQCYLREKSPSLWDCIICHFVSNAVLLLL
jgi:membrane protease YdiL (CAAX protease family)